MKKVLVIHPVLVAIYLIIFFYTHNQREMSAKQIIIPLGVSLGLALFLWLLFGLLLKNRAKAGLATSIFIFLLFTYGQFFNLLKQQDIFVPRHQYLLPGIFLAFGYFVYLIQRARRDFGTTTRVLNIAAVVMLAINAFTIISYQIKVAQFPSPEMRQSELGAQIPSPEASKKDGSVKWDVQNTPDIYFIILDEYANPDVIKEYFGYDNEKFIKSLEGKGFFIARNSIMHNWTTTRAVASILNMEYTPENEPPAVTYNRIIHNEVVNRLRAIGYRYIYFGGWYEDGRYAVEADAYFNYYETSKEVPLTAEVSATLWNTTILKPFFESLAGEELANYHRQAVIRTLDHLVRIPDMEGPKFVYAHIMSPHHPYVFGPEGEHVVPEDPLESNNKEGYLGQYIFISREIDRVIGELLKKSAIEPIIIVQSDHGVRWLGGWEWKKILNAYHLPGDGNKLLHDAVSPVNTFRIIFNYYFNAGYNLLGDR